MRTPRPFQPQDPITSVVEAVHALDAAKAKVSELEAQLAAARTACAKAETRLRGLVPPHQHGDATPAQPGVAVPQNMSICWQIGWRLYANPVLDYQATAEAIWGPGLDKTTAKNRVNAQVTRLKQLGVARSLGSNRHEINAQLLSELSGIPIPKEAVSVMR